MSLKLKGFLAATHRERLQAVCMALYGAVFGQRGTASFFVLSGWTTL